MVSLERTKGIGGSDVAAICGISPWKTAYEVWEEKLGIRSSQPINDAMAYGLMVEPAIRQWYANAAGRMVHVPDRQLVHPKHDFVRASLDGISKDGYGAERVLEIKTARSDKDWGEPGTDEIPRYYRTQVEHYLMVTGLAVADVVVSFAGQMPLIYVVEADKELQEILLEKEVDFWEMVRTKTPPEPVTFSDMLAKFGRKSTAKQVTASQEVAQAVDQLRAIKATVKDLEAQEEAAKAIVMGELGEADTLLDVDGRVLVTWKLAKPSTRFDAKALQSAQPDIYAQYLITGEPSRRFLIK